MAGTTISIGTGIGLGRYGSISASTRGGGGVSYSGDAPNSSDLVYHLDGTIEGSELVDSVNGYNFTINSKDFDSDEYGGCPFKSISTISAPASGAAKVAVLAIDNGFWYDATDTPREIPMISFFQNIDFGNQLFCRHTARAVNADSEEVTPPLVTDICGYSAAQTIDATMTDYFGTEIDRSGIIKALWISKDGNDTTGNGSWDAPFLTINKAEPLLDNGVTYNHIYVKCGEYTENSDARGHLYLRETSGTHFYMTGLGYVSIKSPGATHVVEIVGHDFDFKHIIIDGEGTTSGGYYNAGNILKLDKVNVKGTTSSTGYTATADFNECVMDTGTYLALRGKIHGSIFDYCTGSGAAAYVVEIQYCKSDNPQNVNADNLELASSVAGAVFIIKYNYFKNSNICINASSFLSCNSFTCERNKFESVDSVGGIFRAISFGGGPLPEDGDTCIPSFKYNYIICNHTTQAVMLINGSGFVRPEVMYNLIICDIFQDSTESFRGIQFGIALTDGAYKCNYNRIFTNSVSGYCITSGEDGLDYYTGAEIIGNYCRGHLKDYPLETGETLHGIAAARGRNITVAYNRVEYTPLGIVVKGGSVAYDAGGTYGNICYENESHFYIRETVGLKIYNNTFANNNVVPLRIATFDSDHGVTLSDITLTNNIFTIKDAGNHLFGIELAALTNDRVIFNDNIFSFTPASVDFITDLEAVRTTYTYAEAVTNGWVLNGEEATPVFNNLAAGELWLQAGSPGLGDGTALAAAYDDGLDITTDWNDDETDTDVDNYPVIVTKQQGANWDKGAYVH